MEENNSKKNRLTTLILCWFLGFLGVHRMYTGRLVSGFFMAYGTIAAAALMFVNVPASLAMFVVVGAAVVFDFTLILTKNFKDCYGKDVVLDKIND